MGFPECIDSILNCSLQQLTLPCACMGFPECIDIILNCTLQQWMPPWAFMGFPECIDSIYELHSTAVDAALGMYGHS